VDILKDHLDAIKEGGLRLSGVKEMTATFPEDNLLYSIDEMEGKRYDAVVVAVKASIMQKIMPALRKVHREGTAYVSLQNGLDTEEVLADTFGKENSFRIVVNYGGNLAGNGHVKMNFFNPPNHLGGTDPVSEERGGQLAGLIHSSGLDTEHVPDIKRHEWEKLILNLALAAPCALTGKTMKAMMEFGPTRELARELMREGIDVAAASGYTYEPDFLDRCMDWLDNTGYHMPSMAVDVAEGRPTEIDFLHGKVVEYGKAKGVPTPANVAVTSLIKGRELPAREPGSH
jgi:2-dehydropantoate 2-reductase